MTRRAGRFTAPGLETGLLWAFLAILWLCGGASRADELGQAIVRFASFAIVVVLALVAEPSGKPGSRPVRIVLASAVALGILQLIPLPPALWLSLPGRSAFADAAMVSGQGQPWRPLSMVPTATLNAVMSLIVPAVTLLLIERLDREQQRRLPYLLFGLILASTLLGLVQFSGVALNNPFINDEPPIVSGSFANRNHFALFLALGCLILPVLVFRGSRPARWRLPVGVGLLVLLVLMILATGSRAGAALGALGLLLGIAIAWKAIRSELARAPRWTLPVALGGATALVALAVYISIASDRAVSVQRALAVDVEQDMRGQALPTLWSMVQTYLPFGTGLGSFDTLFRFHEPARLLKPTYFNHAHDDFLEIVLDTGALGAVLLAGAVAWWLWASVAAWRPAIGMPETGRAAPRLGSAILLLMLIASAVDYPVRTPMMMTVAVIAACLLARLPTSSDQQPLPAQAQPL